MKLRIYVEKKDKFNIEAKKLYQDLKNNLHIRSLTSLRLINLYDIFNINEDVFKQAKNIVFSELPTDNLLTEIDLKGKIYFAVEYLPGQFDQRADSAKQCLSLLSSDVTDIAIKSGKLIILEGNLTANEVAKIKRYYINPIEMRIKDLSKLVVDELPKTKGINIHTGFVSMSPEQLIHFKDNLNLAMTYEDLLCIQNYFKDIENRDPSETEIKVLDTYWSDHCRHTTFLTEIKKVVFAKGQFQNILQNTYKKYLLTRQKLYKNEQKPESLMDIATIFGKHLRKQGRLNDLEISEEINACSVYIDVDVDGKIEKWLLQFKNETHNHPTEIEPFGGASTCLGGAIRDPLSGRSYVYQAIRVTGLANPLEKVEDTLHGKLPQRKITTEAAYGFSSYGNQIGLATGHVQEIYDDGYKAKRMEVGAVVGACPVKNVKRESPKVDDLILLIGGKTGRDGCGGATGSSKTQDIKSLNTCSAEVQKGNAVIERKIQRLFRNPKISTSIKKCNDFGAGGVSVAVGELAAGIYVNLDLVPTKYAGLNGTELAISESQERMAVIIDPKDLASFTKLSEAENVIVTVIGKVTDSNRLIFTWRGDNIVDISRDFLDTNGASSKINVEVVNPENKNPLERNIQGSNLKEKILNNLSDLNVCSQKGLVHMFDATIGAATVLMPFGGKYQLTPTDGAINKIPVLNGETDTASIITYGYNPVITRWSPFHGSMYAIIESIAKIVAFGGDWRKIRLSFQEYFEQLRKDEKKWGKVFSALLGAFFVQSEFDTPAIGGKDSMSGSFDEINVPPTLISFAVSLVSSKNVVSPELKETNSNLYILKHKVKKDFMPNTEELKKNYTLLYDLIKEKKIISAKSIGFGGLAGALAKIAFGNKIGFGVNVNEKELFNFDYGSIIIETKEKLQYPNLDFIGTTNDTGNMTFNNISIDINEAIKIWLGKLADVFPYQAKLSNKVAQSTNFITKNAFASKQKHASPNVFIPIFPGTNCEYDSMRAFKTAGAKVNTMVFNNLNRFKIEESIDTMVKNINNSQILMFAGGFSLGDEPEGSAKFIAAIISNQKIAEAINDFMDRDGLILGICNGFQALIKSGLLPFGEIGNIDESSPTLTYNDIGRHISQIVNTKIVSNNSPWLNSFSINEIHKIAVSNGEGKFIINEKIFNKLKENGQIITQYVDYDGNPTNNSLYNPSNSMYAIEGIASPDGRIFGKMGHSERIGTNLYKNIPNTNKQDIFLNGVKYFN